MYVADSSYASTTVRFFSVLFINNINNANVIVFQRHWFSVSHQKKAFKKSQKNSSTSTIASSVL